MPIHYYISGAKFQQSLRRSLWTFVWAGFVAATWMALAQTPDLNNAGLEDLMNIKVTSVDKKD